MSGPVPAAPPAERFLVRSTITEADFRVYARTYVEGMPSMKRVRRKLLGGAIGITVMGVFVSIAFFMPVMGPLKRASGALATGNAAAIGPFIVSLLFLIPLLLPIAAALWAWRRYYRGVAPLVIPGMLRDARLRGMFEPVTLLAEPRGVFVQRPKTTSRIDWPLFESIADRDGVIMLVSRGSPLTITPRSAFATPAEADAFVAACRRWMETAPTGLLADPAGFLLEHDALCPTCGYNLRGGDGVMCPECGTPLTAAALVWGARAVTK